jgi:hypothetical protein
MGLALAGKTVAGIGLDVGKTRVGYTFHQVSESSFDCESEFGYLIERTNDWTGFAFGFAGLLRLFLVLACHCAMRSYIQNTERTQFNRSRKIRS